MSLSNSATITRVTASNMAYMFDHISGKVLPFNFDKITDYKGEPADKLGIERDATVGYEADSRGKVLKVELIARKKKVRVWQVATGTFS